ncbi:MAG: NTP transferase domain-containing protein [Bacteroidales bacterium]|nr:NTP transferase domain-containing protein [Bacteroidales bacterium]
MKALILAAGLGTRLKPLTDSKPKALIEVNGHPLLYYAINKLKSSGITDIIINIHHFAGQIKEYIEAGNFGVNISFSDESDELLDTGGALKKAEWFFAGENAFMIYNADVLSSIDLKAMKKFHKEESADVSLACSERKSTRYLLFDKKGQLGGWQNEKTGELKPAGLIAEAYKKLAYSGISILSPAIIKNTNKKGVFGLTELLLEKPVEYKITAFLHKEKDWMDMGKAESFENKEKINRLCKLF